MTAEAMKWVSVNHCISASVSGCSVPWGPRFCPLRCTLSGKSRLRSTPALQVQLIFGRLPANSNALCWAVNGAGQEPKLPRKGPCHQEVSNGLRQCFQTCVSQMGANRCR